MNINHNSVEIRAFALTATDENDVPKVVTGDTVQVAIKPLGIWPEEPDWVDCEWSVENTDKIQVKFNIDGGFQIASWEPGDYWWKVRPTAPPERPVLDGPDFIEIS